MKKITLPLLISTTLVLLAGCGDNAEEPAYGSGEPPRPIINEKPDVSIPTHPVGGTLRGSPFTAEQSTLEEDVLTIRQGSEFFADLEIKIFLFDDKNLAGREFMIDSKSQQGSIPHVHLGMMKPGEKLPDYQILMTDYNLKLSFGQPNTLGIPYTIEFSAPAKFNTMILGKDVAAFNNVAITRTGDVDLTKDTFDTLRYVGKQHLLEKYKISEDMISEPYGLSIYSGSKDKLYPKNGFLGYIIGPDAKGTTYKVQLQLSKDEQGWRVANELPSNQIPAAHPLPLLSENASERTLQGRKASVVAALEFESALNKKGIMGQIRFSSMRCYLNKDSRAASCEGVYGIKQDEGNACDSVSYLLHRKDQWNVEKVIDRNLQVDYTTGKLVNHKPFDLMCG